MFNARRFMICQWAVLILMLLAGSMTAAAADKLVLVDQGKAVAPIVVYKDAPRLTPRCG